VYSFKITEPADLAGMKISFNEQGTTVEYLGITLTREIPGSSFARVLGAALSNAESEGTPQKKGGETLYSGQCEAGNYTVTLSGSGELLLVEIPALAITAQASDFKLINS
jgi:hypothetical protein